MHLIKPNIMIVVEKANDAACDGDGHPEDIDEQVQLVLHHTTKCDQQEIFDHGVYFFRCWV
jgi:hypothetical protein